MELILFALIVWAVVSAPGWFTLGALIALIHELFKPKEDRFK